MTTQDESLAGAAIYNKAILSVYDIGVLGISNALAWQCPTSQMLAFYDKHISSNHLDIGVGTGYFLDKCRFPSADPKLTLFDLNPNSLQKTAKRVQRYNPTVQVGDVLKPLNLPEKYSSVGLNYLLHCLPGNMREKAVAFENIKAVLKPDGIVFGTTILGKEVYRNFLALTLMRLYNKFYFFSNNRDTLSDLETALQENFRSYHTHVVGCVAFFTGRL